MTLDLNGKWQFRKVTEDSWYDAIVPGSVCSDLISNGLLEEPYYRDNERITLKTLESDFEYRRDFIVDKTLLDAQKIELICHGIDTIADLYINEVLVQSVSDMHRTFKIDVKQYLREEENNIRIYFHSAYLEALHKHEEDPIHTSVDSIYGFTQVRKAHYMYGWDWGPKIPDMGIWRNIELVGHEVIELKDFHITQDHIKDEENKAKQVKLDIKVEVEKYKEVEALCKVVVVSPLGRTYEVEAKVNTGESHIQLTIDDPQLWWPRGYGEQNLYDVSIVLSAGEITRQETLQIGLRTMALRREDDEWGQSFEVCVNDISIFAMGANYIPEDNILSRSNRERTETLIKQCVKANYNCIRVWGGGYFCEDYFYELCDKYGLVVWQDLLFACGKYKLTEEFVENIIEETKDNMKRIRHHASLGVWCGNNEMEWAWDNWDNFLNDPKMKANYIKQFEYILPEVAKEIDGENPYWLSSPSSGGSFEDPNSQDRGDVHYWDVWHKLKPFTEYRKFHFRFCSEFGFQSFPCIQTVRSFTKPEDRNIFSYVMEQHQKNGSANGLILFYLSDNFKYPTKFEDLLYISQLLQAEAIKYGVEHWRANRGRCMGALYWQLNDSWPVASWSSIDYYGRWKALHYYAKKFYAPILLSAIDEETKVTFNVSNETLYNQHVEIAWSLRKNTGEVLRRGEIKLAVPKLSAVNAKCLDFAAVLETIEAGFETILEYRLLESKEEVSANTLLFAKAKHFNFLDPKITYEVKEKEDRFILTFKTENFAKYVELSSDDFDFVASDNYFDLIKDEVKVIEMLKEDLSREIDLKELKNSLIIRSIYDTLDGGVQ